MPVTIGDGTSFARVAPELGGMVTAFWSRRGPDHLHWLWPIPDEQLALTATPKGGMFVMAPFSNRIDGAHLRFRGREHALEPHPEAAPAAMHGYANRRPWRVIEQKGSSLTLVLEGADPAWPWRLRMVQRLAIEAGALRAELEVTSLDQEPQPIGLGFHPFLTRSGGNRLSIGAGTRWTTEPSTRPIAAKSTGTAVPLDLALDPLAYDRYLGDWTGNAQIIFPSLGAALDLRTDAAALPYVLLFCPEGRPIFCIEPVSHLTGAFELPEPRAVAQGMRVLAPGQSLRATLELAPILTLE